MLYFKYKIKKRYVTFSKNNHLNNRKTSCQYLEKNLIHSKNKDQLNIIKKVNVNFKKKLKRLEKNRIKILSLIILDIHIALTTEH